MITQKVTGGFGWNFQGRLHLPDLQLVRFWWQTVLPPGEYEQKIVVSCCFCIRQVAVLY